MILSYIKKAKPLGRPSAVQKHISPGERNPIYVSSDDSKYNGIREMACKCKDFKFLR